MTTGQLCIDERVLARAFTDGLNWREKRCEISRRRTSEAQRRCYA